MIVKGYITKITAEMVVTIITMTELGIVIIEHKIKRELYSKFVDILISHEETNFDITNNSISIV